MIPWTCWIGLHMWSKWSEPRGTIYIRQTRTCRGCGKVKERSA